jgi:hypothetical protein
LENHGYIEYDRVADQITVADTGRNAIEDPLLWTKEARRAFADHISDGDDSSISDVSEDSFDETQMEDILDSVIDISDPDVIQIDDGAELANDPSFTDFEPAPEIATNVAEEVPTTEASHMTQDSFASRRLSTGTTPAAT